MCRTVRKKINNWPLCSLVTEKVYFSIMPKVHHMIWWIWPIHRDRVMLRKPVRTPTHPHTPNFQFHSLQCGNRRSVILCVFKAFLHHSVYFSYRVSHLIQYIHWFMNMLLSVSEQEVWIWHLQISLTKRNVLMMIWALSEKGFLGVPVLLHHTIMSLTSVPGLSKCLFWVGGE